MKFNLIVKSEKSASSWKETIEKPFSSKAEVEGYCKEIVEFFNSTLRPGESPREYIA